MGRTDRPRCLACRLQNKIKRRRLPLCRGEQKKPVGPVVYSDVYRLTQYTGDDAYLLKDRGDMGSFPFPV